jgi:stage V sporulation protein SpoVS
MGEIPALLTIGQQSINQAVKGIAAAAQELKTVGDLTFQPAFRHENRTKPLIAFYLSRGRFNSRIDTGEEVELTATANQKIVSLAGAIAGKVRAECFRCSMIT